MEAELVEVFRLASKAADAAAVNGKGGGADEEGRCIDALQRLKSFPVTTQVLVSTQVGKGLRRLTKHPRKKIQAFASDLIQQWKQIVMEESKGCKRNASVDNHECAKTGENKVENSSSFQSEAKKRKTEPNGTPDSEKLSPNPAQPVSAMVAKYDDLMRDRARELLFEALSRVSGEASNDIIDEVNACDPSSIAVSVESTLFQNWGCMNGTHKMKYRSIMFNIKDPNNPDFRRKPLLGHVEPERLLNMTTEEMASNERQLRNQQIKERALSRCELGTAPEAMMDQLNRG
ncbi:transcription elongation factor TFIIS-like [Rhodamnia argentea]|uniref:Transcription elongation factor TFIIS-like n=1 Tax=Rhodamnia argentea TaxID=178133 RepID=A0A8B8NZV5_9MYRT|nr:transcription elongation factor TFIIS-like [Rhodamnia argentea]